MTISNTEVRKSYTGNGSLAIYPFPFTVYAVGDIVVHVSGVLQVQGVHYDVTGTFPGSGNVVFRAGSIPASDASILIESSTPLTQLTALPAAGRFYEGDVEAMANKLTVLLHQLRGRSIQLPLGSPLAGPLMLPTLEAGKFLRVNPAGTGLEVVSALLSDLVGILDDTVPSCGHADLPVAGTAGRLRQLTDGYRGLWYDNGTDWASVSGPHVDMRLMGAKLDGATDDSAFLSAALAQVASGGTILVPGVLALGTAGWTGIKVSSKNGIRIVGVGKGAGVKVLAQPSQHLAGADYRPVVLLENCTKCEVSGLDFDGNAQDCFFVGLDTCSDCTVEGNVFHDTGADHENMGIFSIGGLRNRFLNNTVKDCGRGIWVGNTESDQRESHAVIAGNIVKDNAATGIGGTMIDSVIFGNIIDGNGGSGIALGSLAPVLFENVSIVGNVIRNQAWHGVQADGSSFTAANAPRGIAVVGNVIESQVMSGVYCYGAKDWTILGNVIRNCGYGGSATGNGITLGTCDGVIIFGNQIYDDQAVPTQAYGIMGDVADRADDIVNLFIYGNIIRNGQWFGVYLANSGAGTGGKVVADGNHISGFDRAFSITAAYSAMNFSNNYLSGTSYAWVIDATDVCGINNTIGSGGVWGVIPIRLGLNRITYGTAAPTTGTWIRGDKCINTEPSAGGPPGWSCVTGGTPGTWKAEANLAS